MPDNSNQNQNTAADYGLDPDKYAIVDRAPITPQTPAVSSAMLPQKNPYISSVAANSVQLDTDLAQTTLTGAVPVWRVMPQAPNSNPAVISASQSTTQFVSETASPLLLKTNGNSNPNQKVFNAIGEGLSITADAAGNVTFDSTATGDGLVHGQTPWESDPSWVGWRDDFWFNAAGSSVFYGELGWAATTSDGNIVKWAGTGGQANRGALQLQVNTTSSTVPTCILGPYMGDTDSGDIAVTGLALLEYPGWQMTWVFSQQRSSLNTSGWQNLAAFDSGHQSTYIGLVHPAGGVPSASATVVPLRPPQFIGLRLDTDPGTTYTLTAAATAVGTTTTYTGTFTNGNASWAGLQFTIAGFTNAGNNGTFVCTTASGTSITVVNSAGVNESHAATATTPSIGDTTYHFEAVLNPMPVSSSIGIVRNNIQGQTQDTGVSPSEFVWHRLTMSCTTAGIVTMQLDNGPIFTVTIPQGVWTASGTNPFSTTNGLTRTGASGGINYTGLGTGPVFGSGSIVTVGGSGVPTGAAGTFTIYGTTTGGDIFYTPSSGTPSGNVTNATITGWPTWMPYVGIASDSSGGGSAAGKSINVDFFSLIWNGGLANETANSAKARYF